MSNFYCHTNNARVSIIKVLCTDKDWFKVWILRQEQYGVSLRLVFFKGGLISIDTGSDNLTITWTLAAISANTTAATTAAAVSTGKFASTQTNTSGADAPLYFTQRRNKANDPSTGEQS